jgi:hypothetical protein
MHIVRRTLQPPALVKAGILVYPDQKLVDFVRLGGKGQHAMMRGEKDFHKFAI